MSWASFSVYVPSGSPGNVRLRFLPSAGTTNAERCVNDSMLTTGTAVMLPLSWLASSSRITRVTAAIDEYSQPWMPPISERFGPSPAPWTLKAGTSRPFRWTVVRTRVIQYGQGVFRQLGEADLTRLDDDALIGYVRDARRVGHPSARDALAVLAFGHWHNVARRVALKVPASFVEDVTSDVLVSAIQSAFDGVSEGEFAVWLRTITARRIADFHRRPVAQTVPLEDVSLEAPEEGMVLVSDAVERVLGRLSDSHRQVVELVVFEGRAAGEVGGFSAANVHQIASRFRRALREELDTG